MTVDRALTSLGIAEGDYNAKNAWTGERLHMSSRVTATIEPHASIVLMLDKK